MSAKTSIAWTDATWNPTVGCSRVSAGCEHCYAERFAHRWHTTPGHALSGLTVAGKHGPRWNGVVRLNEKALELPLRWRKPRRIFVNSMSDLFHESLTDEQIDRAFAVMACSARHTFQVLTKRPERMRAYSTRPRAQRDEAIEREARSIGYTLSFENLPMFDWPLPNVHLGVSVENQETADERIPLLLETPAAKRFVSYEPALGPVDFTVALNGTDYEHLHPRAPVDQIIVGGESGPGARPCDVAWIRSVVEQCRAAGVACFVKQLGSSPIWSTHPPMDVAIIGKKRRWQDVTKRLKSRSGADPSEWPEDLRVQELIG